MKLTCQLALLTLIATVLCAPAAAQTRYWGPDNTLGGDGTWTSSSTNWGTSDSGPFNVSSSNNGHNNNFAGDVGTVTVDGSVNLRSLRFTTDGYRVEGGADDPTLQRTSGGGILLAANATGITTTVANLTLSVGSQSVPVNVGFGTGDLENLGTIVLENIDFVSQNVIIRSGTAVMGGTNSFSGSEIEVWDGATLAVASDAALGAGTMVFTAGRLMSANTEQRIISDNVRLAQGDGTASIYLGSNDAAHTGTLVFTGEGTLQGGGRGLWADSRVVFEGGIGETSTGSDLAKRGPGTLVLAGENSYTGLTRIESGTLLVNGSTHANSDVIVRSASPPNATLGGSGTIGGTVTVNSGGILSPGDGIGMLTFGNTVTLAGGSRIYWEFDGKEIAGVDYDLLRGQGENAALYLPDPQSDPITLSIFGPGATLKLGDTFTLFDGAVFDHNEELLGLGADLKGLFAIDDHSGWWGTWEVTGGSLMLTAVPEPGTWLLLLSALGCGLLVRKRR